MKPVEMPCCKRSLIQAPTLEGLVEQEYSGKHSAEVLVDSHCSVNVPIIVRGSILDTESKDEPSPFSVSSNPGETYLASSLGFSTGKMKWSSSRMALLKAWMMPTIPGGTAIIPPLQN